MQLDRRLYRTTGGRVCEQLEPGESGMLLGVPGHILSDAEAFRLGVTEYFARTQVRSKAVRQQEVEDKALSQDDVEDKGVTPPGEGSLEEPHTEGGMHFPSETRRGPGRPPRSS